VRIIESVTRLPAQKARALLSKANRHVKTALAMGILGTERSEAEELLKENGGFLRRLLDRPHTKNPNIDAIFFDMDGTIVHYDLPIGLSTWAALGWALGIFSEQEEWVEQYLTKRVSFEEVWKTCAQRIAGRTFEEIRDVLFPCAGLPPYSRGFTDCIPLLRHHYRLGIISSGISVVAEEIQKSLHLDFECSNLLGLSQGKFDGTHAVRVPFDHKSEVVRKQADALGIPMGRICFVGDSSNDIQVFRAVGLPVAYNPKTEAVIEAAHGNVIGDFLQLPLLLEKF
ncbi:MAG TPA: HAD-IB family phosphatase, partial [Bdellovibrionota bacterium]|nr:HAD-IB family phosphatase [Bdellovibrionota bacterium]